MATKPGEGATLPAPVRLIIERSYGVGVADIFLAAVPLGVVALVAVPLLRELPLGTRTGIELAEEARRDADEVEPETEPVAGQAGATALDFQGALPAGGGRERA